MQIVVLPGGELINWLYTGTLTAQPKDKFTLLQQNPQLYLSSRFMCRSSPRCRSSSSSSQSRSSVSKLIRTCACQTSLTYRRQQVLPTVATPLPPGCSSSEPPTSTCPSSTSTGQLLSHRGKLHHPTSVKLDSLSHVCEARSYMRIVNVCTQLSLRLMTLLNS